MKKLFSFILSIFISQHLYAQQGTQTIRGVIRDEVSQSPVIGASILLLQTEGDNPVGTVTDVNGEFRMTGIPNGRQSLRITSVGYEEQTLGNIVVSAGKEVILTITMTENIQKLNEVTVTADRKNDQSKTNNELALVGGRSFNIDDTRRYAGTLGDPSRMAANFAGVVSGNDARNDIVVRGNSPSGMLWQLEGLNIPNPNHFGSLGSTGGPVSMLNNNTLDKSDFLTSAFPAQYGNALAAVFDLRMREGNNQKNEFLGQLGFNGFELGAEGPLSRKSKASYLLNYRYSTLGVFKALGIRFGTGTAVPDYNDLNFKIAIPTGTRGKFTAFGIMGGSDVAFLGNEVDTTASNLYGSENTNTRAKYKTNIAGLSYEHTFSAKTFAKLTLGTSTTNEKAEGDSISIVTREAFKSGESRFKTTKYSAVFNLRHKINTKHSLYGGVTTDLLGFDLYSRSFYEGGLYDTLRLDVKGENTLLTQAYLQWKYRISRSLILTTGMHGQHFSLNDHMALNPRLGLQYAFGRGQSISVGYGLNSQAQNIYTYFIQTQKDAGAELTNKNLDFTRSHHFIMSYENRIGENLLLKIEPYYQQLYHVPVERNRSSFSILNTGSTFGGVDKDSLVNEGTGENLGIELTLERYFNKGYFFLLTTSLFNSKYKGSDGISRNTAFNSHYVLNLLAGKEVRLGTRRDNVVSASIRTTLVGGKYVAPLNLEQSRIQGKAVYDETLAFSERQPTYFRTDLKLSYRKELRKCSIEGSIDIQNLTCNKNTFMQTYNARTNSMATIYQTGFFPMSQFRITF
ncbi:hypothetical protein DYBT9275_02338 [Dyadobacter sp. CECT 9275]|uniref:TonB-dependent receptor n=1 Tax=Dyadobacter helix TaxID=2822344 RepID=A0A916JCE4_9BACT|nr:TonB-dependent receptor [Dyadobacter sp. CECT 9275]CAG4999896.1 hypothetical protein DYBT9275_02338 [Dyadobacter sp. CECT 9275]